MRELPITIIIRIDKEGDPHVDLTGLCGDENGRPFKTAMLIWGKLCEMTQENSGSAIIDIHDKQVHP